MPANARTSRLAVASLSIIAIWYLLWLACVVYVYVMRGATGQRWDMIPIMWACWAGWYPFCVLATVLGIQSLLRIHSSNGLLRGSGIAITSIALSQASFVVGLVGPYLPDFLP